MQSILYTFSVDRWYRTKLTAQVNDWRVLAKRNPTIVVHRLGRNSYSWSLRRPYDAPVHGKSTTPGQALARAFEVYRHGK